MPLTLLLAAGFAFGAHAISLDVNQTDSITAVAKTIAGPLLADYDGNRPGQIPGTYGQMSDESHPDYDSDGAIWDALVDYSFLTGDGSNDSTVRQALLWQLGDNDNYMPANWSAYIYNEDQLRWGLAALTAAERNFTAPSQTLSWTQVARNVFDDVVARWDKTRCSGGLRSALYVYQGDYNVKDSASNAQLFVLAAKLAQLQTGSSNATYETWASNIYSWMSAQGLIDDKFNVLSELDAVDGCTVNNVRWSADAAAIAYGAALMANATGNATWVSRVGNHVARMQTYFFDSDVASEPECRRIECRANHEDFYLGHFARDLARTAALLPGSNASDVILPLLQASARAEAGDGCQNNGTCASAWSDRYPGLEDAGTAGAQYSGLQLVQQLLLINGAANASTPGSDGSSNGTGSGTSTTSASGPSTVTPTSTGASGTASPSPSQTTGAAVSLIVSARSLIALAVLAMAMHVL